MTLEELEAEVMSLKAQVAELAYAKDILDICSCVALLAPLPRRPTARYRPCSPRRPRA
jgi:hypothetical protein